MGEAYKLISPHEAVQRCTRSLCTIIIICNINIRNGLHFRTVGERLQFKTSINILRQTNFILYTLFILYLFALSTTFLELSIFSNEFWMNEWKVSVNIPLLIFKAYRTVEAKIR